MSRDAHARDWDFQFGLTTSGGWLREMPSLSSEPVRLDSRRIGEGSLRGRGGLGMAAIGADTGFTIDDRWMLPVTGFYAWWAVGNYDSVTTSFDGSIAHLKPWTASRFDILLPGFGRRIKLRRNMVSFAFRTGATYLGMDGTAAGGTETSNLELSKWSFLAQVEVEGCRRLDPTFRACVQVVPRIYENTFLNGLSVGFRLEWGR